MTLPAQLPERIVDMHTHMFNARYLPLASIIADAMHRKHSVLADRVARLLQEITASSYDAVADTHGSGVPAGRHRHADHADHDEARDEAYLELLWQITEHRLLAPAGAAGPMHGDSPPGALAISVESISERALGKIVADLADIDYRAEGWEGDTGALAALHPAGIDLHNYLAWGRGVVKTALRIVCKLMDPHAWGKAENYLEFFLLMLRSEKSMMERIISGYGQGLPDVQMVHMMMDMQMGYPSQQPPYYPFFPDQLEYMQRLQQDYPARLFGFSAFDPRHPDWEARADAALARGFIGFKFYPAMGYLPWGDPEHRARIEAFYDYCIRRDVPIFVHCTPEGFQTRRKSGVNAHPKHWEAVLRNPRWHRLRLCLGHAGGEESHNGGITSFGWMASCDEQWDAPDNFARIVAHLCVTYPNVYCEFAYLTGILEPAKRRLFVRNVERALAMQGDFRFSDKAAYGSDWHMPDMVDTLRQYLDCFLTLFTEEPFEPWREQFFWKNAYAYMKLPRRQEAGNDACSGNPTQWVADARSRLA